MDPDLDALAGARVDAVYVVPETGLVVLAVWGVGGARRLGVGVGPRLAGIGWLPWTPGYTAGVRHPLVAVLKARVVGETVRSAGVDPDDGAVWVTVGGDRVTARVRLVPGVRGDVRVLGPTGETVLTWQGDTRKSPRAMEVTGTLEEAGTVLVRTSDALAAELRRADLLTALRAHTKRLVRRAEAVRGDLARLDGAGRWQRIGRMLLAQGNTIPRGSTRATLEDWEEGGTLTVDLDPARPARMQAEGFFQRARRLQRGEAVMRGRLAETERALEAVRAVETDVEAAEALTPGALAGWWQRARAVGAGAGGGTEGTGTGAARRSGARTEKPTRVPYITYVGWRDHRILVGRGPADNDTLTLQVARPHDLWLHVRGTGGAHVVVPLDRGAQCPSELLVDAATLAAHHSDARGETTAEVTWVEKRYVRKARKAPPGKVVFEREKVLTLRVEPARLERLLASRVEG